MSTEFKIRLNPCPPATVENDAVSPTYTDTVNAGDTLFLPDQQINVNSVDEGDIASVGTIDINITDGVNPVVPNSVGIVGRTVTVEVPSGGGVVMDVDFSADKLTAAPLEAITFTDLSDENPTHWSWRFGDGTTSIVQNPVKSFTSVGVYDVTLLAGRVGAGSVAIKNAYIEILIAYFTNIFSTPTSAYSLRKLSPNSVYAGPAIRVRRSSDNTEQDINFVTSLANANIDTAALLTFVGAGNGFVTVWYDQSGNARHTTQTSAAIQPQIVSSGNLITKNGKICVDFNSQNENLSILNISPFSEFSHFVVATPNTLSGTDFCQIAGHVANNGQAIGVRPTLKLYDANGIFNTNANNNTIALNEQAVLSSINTSSDANLFKNGNNISTAIGTVGTYDDIILGNSGNALINIGNGTKLIHEYILYASDKSADRAAIETNINDYYNVF